MKAEDQPRVPDQDGINMVRRWCGDRSTPDPRAPHTEEEEYAWLADRMRLAGYFVMDRADPE